MQLRCVADRVWNRRIAAQEFEGVLRRDEMSAKGERIQGRSGMGR